MSSTEIVFRKALSQRIKDVAKERGHSHAECARQIGVDKNSLHRLVHWDHPTYESVQNMGIHAAVMDYCGISWGDFEAKHPSTMSEVLACVDRLPGLDDGQKHVMRTTLMSLYCSMRDAARGESDG